MGTILRSPDSGDAHRHADASPFPGVPGGGGTVHRIALVTAFPPGRGDLSEYGFQLARVLQESWNLTPEIFADIHDDEPEELAGYDVRRCWRFNSIASFFDLIRKIRRARPEVVWFNIGLSTMANSPVAAMAAAATPWILHLLGFNTHVTLHAFSENVDFDDAGVPFPAVYRFGARLATRLLLLTDGVHVLLPSYREKMVKALGCSGKNIFVHSHGVFAFQTDSANSERVPGVILAFGSWGTYKRLEGLLEAFREVESRMPGVQLWVAGGDHPKARGYLEHCASSLRDGAHVRFLGYIAEEVVPGLFRSANVAVLPYSSSAGSSGVVHLACEHEVPVVASDVGDLRELAEFENLRLEFFPPEDTVALRDRLLLLLNDAQLREQMAAHNRRAVERLSLRNVVGEYLRVFDEIRSQRACLRQAETPPETT